MQWSYIIIALTHQFIISDNAQGGGGGVQSANKVSDTDTMNYRAMFWFDIHG